MVSSSLPTPINSPGSVVRAATTPSMGDATSANARRDLASRSPVAAFSMAVRAASTRSWETTFFSSRDLWRS